MNLELLTKLVKLANNNPNENEANLAARKVCKIIEENKFQFNGNSNKESTKQNAPPRQNPYTDWFTDFYTNRTYSRSNWDYYSEKNTYKETYKEPPKPKEPEPVKPTEKETEKAEWFYEYQTKLYKNYRTGRSITEIEYKNRFGSIFGGKIIY